MVKLMKKQLLNFIFSTAAIIAFAIALFSCRDPVFYTISKEVEPIEPRIKGTPINFVIYNNYMYTASGSTLHYYTKDKWESGPNPGGKILMLAVFKDDLYALCNEGSGVNTGLKRFDGSSWSEKIDFDNDGTIQSIFAAGDYLFIGVTKLTLTDPPIHSIWYFDGTAFSDVEIKTKVIIKEEDVEKEETQTLYREINGAVYDGTNYYLSTNDGVYRTGSDLSIEAVLLEGSSGKHFTGIIGIDNDSGGNTIMAITRNGELYTPEGDTAKRIREISLGDRMTTGSLAVWVDKDDNSERLLLVGRQDILDYTVDSGYTYGYLELELDADGTIKAESDYKEPGLGTPTSLQIKNEAGSENFYEEPGNNERYKSTIGKHPVNHIFQVPPDIDDNMVLFASTQKGGVFSYRLRNDEWQWNAED